MSSCIVRLRKWEKSIKITYVYILFVFNIAELLFNHLNHHSVQLIKENLISVSISQIYTFLGKRMMYLLKWSYEISVLLSYVNVEKLPYPNMLFVER